MFLLRLIGWRLLSGLASSLKVALHHELERSFLLIWRQILEDRQLAGSVAGMVLSQFSVLAMISGVAYCASWLGRLGSGRPFPRMALILCAIGLLIIAYSQFVLTPEIALLRDTIRSGGETPELAGRFGRLHGTSVVLFGLQWVMAASAFVVHTYKTFARH